ncbi:MAG: HD domain-containing protein [Spirochaetales bacterium]|nr:HD domain-containing protein [Spirochaetales bacterium]MDD7610430.1 HD domain-containing protein [Spirochaetales bacterium]
MHKSIKIKDPLFGYIEIDDDDVYQIINTAEFHRLQDIIQTSYSSVYPTCLHNRFIHSIGVYYLGCLAIKGISNNSKELFDEDKEKYIKIFLLACLLHDVGHAPFSHTGEDFYIAKSDNGIPVLRKKLWDMLAPLDEKFLEDDKILAGAPHELMSAYEGITIFSHYIPDEYKSFFVRCIIGLKYQDQGDIRNCLIDLLNSKTIDVDKLDYLIRDSYYSGFKTVNIDYQRLLSAVCIDEKKEDEEVTYKLGFTKAALSTLESVILAHDMERKWMQNHPTIQYENQLLVSILKTIIDDYAKYNIELFSLKPLTHDGIEGTRDIKISNEVIYPEKKSICLLSDSDIISASKCFIKSNVFVQEYFDRSKRMKPLWKSESEYRILFEHGNLNLQAVKNLVDKFDSIISILKGFPLINDTLLKALDNEIQTASENHENNSEDSIFDMAKIQEFKIKELKELKALILTIKKFSEQSGYKFEYAVIANKQFYSGFNKSELRTIPIYFQKNSVKNLIDCINLFEQEKPIEKFFYIYTTEENRNNFNVAGFVETICNCAYHNYRISQH